MSGRQGRPESGRLSGAVFWAFAALVAWAPLPLASARPWAWLLLSGLALALLGLWGAAAVVRPWIVRIAGTRYAVAAVGFAVAVAWFLLQTTTWLPSPDEALWRQAAQALGKPLPATASLDPRATLLGTLRLLGYGAVFFLAMQMGREPRRAAQLLWVIGAAATGYALYGLSVYFSGNATLLGDLKWAYRGDLTSTFVNRNAYGAYAGLGLLAIFALMARVSSGSVSMGLGNRAGFTHFVDSLEPVFFGLAMSAMTVATALLFTHSRGGLAITVAGGATMLAALAVGHAGRRRTIAGTAAALVVLGIGLVELSGQQTLGRVIEFSEQGSGREEIHAMTRRAIADAPVVGFGLDTFPQVFYLYRDDRIAWHTPRFDKAHGAYLELVVEGGAVGFAGVMVAFLYIAGVQVTGLYRRRRNRIYPALGLGAMALVGVHAFYDFSIQIPAVAVTCLTLMGLGFAQSWPTRDAVDDGG